MHNSLWWTLPVLLLASWIGAVPTGTSTSNDDSQSQQLIDKYWQEVSTSYPKYENTTKLIQDLEAAYPDLIKVYTVGKSVQGREMWAINLRTNMKQERKLLQPPMKIVANMHGDEAVGRALVLMLVGDLVKRFNANDAR